LSRKRRGFTAETAEEDPQRQENQRVTGEAGTPSSSLLLSLFSYSLFDFLSGFLCALCVSAVNPLLSSFDCHEGLQLGDGARDAGSCPRIAGGTDPLVGVRGFLLDVGQLLCEDVPPHLDVGPAEIDGGDDSERLHESAELIVVPLRRLAARQAA